MTTTEHGISQSEHGAATRERLLDAAEELFAANGFAGTSIRDITTQSGCNVAAVNYHFGGKSALYREVFRRRLTVLREQRVGSVQRALTRGRTPPVLESVLLAFANAFLEPLVEESRGRLLIELWSREMLDPQLPPQTFDLEVVGPVQEVLGEALSTAAPGLSRGAARACVVSIVGQLVQIARRARWAALTGARNGHAPRLESMVRHVVRFSAAGIRACAQGDLAIPAAAHRAPLAGPAAAMHRRQGD
ncbi:MAG TPA: CerR family C-terminal domain-containing protein [Thermoanaerobaculaceae bacterium]|nr:CerR family C-terminal domain-containing protein [Thermoanaerobaculaceae bacterium]